MCGCTRSSARRWESRRLTISLRYIRFCCGLIDFIFLHLIFSSIRYRPALPLETVSINYFYFISFFSLRFVFFIHFSLLFRVALNCTFTFVHSQMRLSPTKCIFFLSTVKASSSARKSLSKKSNCWSTHVARTHKTALFLMFEL